MPLWIQVAIAGEALALGYLTGRFGWRGLLVGAAAAAAIWFLLGFSASFLVSRLEGGRPGVLSDLLPGAALATLRLAQVASPLIVAAAVLGALVRWLSRRRPRPSPLAGEGGGEADG
jgi:hypothetical protein